MTCPKCGGADIVTTRTISKESVTIRYPFWTSEKKKEEETVEHACTKCGEEWGE